MEPRGSPRQGAASKMSPGKQDASDVYVGLVNQAMTCYLNSLLQTLFMTPEFRNALYNWEYTGSNEEQNRSIPYQLQKLFVLLQTSVGVKTSLETKELTKSFGWDSSHAWDQHDVQELCRVMFDALELKWRGTNQATVITALYQGTMKDYVKCLQCSTENARNDVFLDLPLAIKPFGSNQAYRSVEEALQGFVQPEVLDGTNQYQCEICQKKVNAHKGLKVTKFPYLLTIQLKRFDFDYTTMHRIKLNDRMTFPDLLNLNPFVECEQPPSKIPTNEPSASHASDCTTSTTDDPASSTTGVEAMDVHTMGEKQVMHPPNEDPTEAAMAGSGDSDDEGICVDGTMGTANSGAESPIDAEEEDGSTSYHDPTLVNSSIDRAMLEHYLKQGPYVYELFSIMVHSGSANGGHYYAYIKNLDTEVWYCFNDQVVTRASIEDIRKTYGGASSSPFMYSSYGSSTNAYMLMYRQFDPARNTTFPSNTKLPEHIVHMIDKLHLEEEEQRLVEERQRSLITTRVHFYDPTNGELLEKEFEVQKRDFVSSLLEMAYDAFELSGPQYNIPLELCRLVRFSKQKELLESSLDNSVPIQQALPPWHCIPPELLLEVAPWPGWFRPYNNNGITLSIYIVDLDAGRVRMPKILMYATKEMTVMELKGRIAELLKFDVNRMTLVLDHYSRNLRLLDVPLKTLSGEDLYNRGTIFVQCATDGDAVADGDGGGGGGEDFASPMTPEEFEKTRFYAILDQYKNTIRIKVALPSNGEYESVGLESTFKVDPSADSMDSAHQTDGSSKESVHSAPHSQVGVSAASASGGTCVVGGESKMMLMPVHHPQHPQQEECSTASGSTQYVTPATSRHPSPERGSAVSPVSQADRSASGLTTPDVEAGMSCGGTPSPQVSPDASPISGGNYAAGDPDDQFVPNYSTMPPPVQALFNFSPQFDWTSGGKKIVPQTDSCIDAERKTSVDNTTAAQPDVPDGEYTNNDDAAEAPVFGSTAPASEKVDYFFEVGSVQAATSGVETPVLYIDADRRMLLTEFIQKLAPHVGVNSDQFKLYKVYASSEYECTNSSSTTLESISYINELRVKLGRPLKEGESLVKFVKLDIGDLEVCGKFLFDIPLTKDSSIGDIKQECRVMLKRHCGLDVPVDRIRLRDGGTGSMDILHDEEIIDNRNAYWSNDIYLQLLEEPEIVVTPQHTSVFARRWCPYSLSTGPVQEIILMPTSPEDLNEQYRSGRVSGLELFTKLSLISNIPLNKLQCSSPMTDGAFPYECAKLKLLEQIPFFGLPSRPEQRDASSVSVGCSEMDSEGDVDKGSTATAGQDGVKPDIADTESGSGVGFGQSARFAFSSFHNEITISRDGMLIYYRDGSEQAKTLSDDERKELQIRDNARLRRHNTAYSWRKERALKIYTEISSSLADDLD